MIFLGENIRGWLCQSESAGLFAVANHLVPEFFQLWSKPNRFLPAVREPVEIVAAAGWTHFRDNEDFTRDTGIAIEPK